MYAFCAKVCMDGEFAYAGPQLGAHMDPQYGYIVLVHKPENIVSPLAGALGRVVTM